MESKRFHRVTVFLFAGAALVAALCTLLPAPAGAQAASAAPTARALADSLEEGVTRAARKHLEKALALFRERDPDAPEPSWGRASGVRTGRRLRTLSRRSHGARARTAAGDPAPSERQPGRRRIPGALRSY